MIWAVPVSDVKIFNTSREISDYNDEDGLFAFKKKERKKETLELF